MIRLALRSEMPALLRISQRSFDTSWSAASFEAEFLKDYARVYVYEKGGMSVAYLIVWVLADEGEIVSLAVDNSCRNQGVASAMLRYAFDAHRDVKMWSLEVEPNNITAYNLYEKNFFSKVRVIKNYYGNGRDAVQMVRHIC